MHAYIGGRTYKYDGTNGGSDTTTNAECIKPSTRKINRKALL